ncbi:MAG: hypothetical protein IPO37_13970 [Saprospiraceae bacterium]|nr:hypothetical protein [Saprospiraceae bacterium]
MKGESRTTAMMIDSLSLHPSHSLGRYLPFYSDTFRQTKLTEINLNEK